MNHDPLNDSPFASNLWAEIQAAVRAALHELLLGDAWRSYTGPWSERLESELLCEFGSDFCGLTCSGTTALEMLLRGAQVGEGDEVLIAAYDYPGTFAAIEKVGARPVLIDVAPNSWIIDRTSLDASIMPTCKAIIASHLHGQIQPMQDLYHWSQRHGLLLIQDACQAAGARPGNIALTNCADATILSFGGSKVLSAGRGGAWLTSDAKLAQRTKLAEGAGSGAYSISQLQAAAVSAQLQHLSAINERCRTYFASVQQEIAKHCPNWLAPWQNDLPVTAFYQAGWLKPAMPTAGPVHFDTSSAPGIGTGFPGFHRRSTRRCRIGSPLINTPDIVERTISVHHRLALEGKTFPAHIAGQLTNRLPQ